MMRELKPYCAALFLLFVMVAPFFARAVAKCHMIGSGEMLVSQKPDFSFALDGAYLFERVCIVQARTLEEPNYDR